VGLGVNSAPFNALLGSTDTAIITVEDARETAAQKPPGALGALAAGAAAAVPVPSVPKHYKVQFNPQELHLNATQNCNVQGSVEVVDQNKGIAKVHIDPPQLGLSFQLVFDQMNLAKSFISERFSTGAAAVLTNLATMGAGIGGKDWSVQPVVEAFIGALRNPYTRRITFSWGEFSFTGSLDGLSANYTMFSAEGKPVRATVDVALKDTGRKMVSQLKADFEKAFNAGAAATDLRSVGSAVGNIFNA
jgi:hypothetical protein